MSPTPPDPPSPSPALLAALAWRRATPRAGVWSIAAGMTVTLVWEIAGLLRGTTGTPAYPFGLQTIYPALAASAGVLVVITLTGRMDESAAER